MRDAGNRQKEETGRPLQLIKESSMKNLIACLHRRSSTRNSPKGVPTEMVLDQKDPKLKKKNHPKGFLTQKGPSQNIITKSPRAQTKKVQSQRVISQKTQHKTGLGHKDSKPKDLFKGPNPKDLRVSA